MIKIYKYNHNDRGFQSIVNDNTLKGKKREEVLDNWIKTNGTEVTISDYFNDNKRDSFYNVYSYHCDGKPDNCIERLAYAELEYDSDLSYCNVRERSPEDLIESRTSWYEMRDHADGLAYFIDSLKSEIANGTICVKNYWKPSNEQMEALWDSIPENVKEISEREMLLNSLYQDLKKLREE